MKRFWIGLGILLFLLGLGTASAWGIQSIHDPIAKQLQQAGQAAADGAWDQAQTLLEDSQHRWHKWQHFTAAFADHAPMEEINSLFAELKIYAQARDALHFSALCARLAHLTQAIAESHCPFWWNFL